VLVVAVGLAFAGSGSHLAAGTKIGGVDVGGMTPARARSVLAARAAALAKVPVTFFAGTRRVRISAYELGVKADWRAAVAAARREGDGFAFVRGYRRLLLRLSPPSINPRATAYRAAVDYEVGVLAAAVDRAARDARLVRRGLRLDVQPGRAGAVLDRSQAAQTIVQALAGFDRTPVALPVRRTAPRVTADELAAAAKLDRRVLSAPVTLALGARRWRLSRWRLASMLLLQHDARSPLRLGGRSANAYFARLSRLVGRPARLAGSCRRALGSGSTCPARSTVSSLRRSGPGSASHAW